jgi:hypothetical protein
MLIRMLLVFSLAIAAWGDSPHFLKADADVNNSGGLVVTFKEAGLGNAVTSEVITAQASASAVYECINGGDKHPKASNKETVNSEVSASGEFPVRNGSVSGSLTISPPGPGSFSCPAGQSLVFVSVTYTNVSVTGAGVTAGIPGTFTF